MATASCAGGVPTAAVCTECGGGGGVLPAERVPTQPGGLVKSGGSLPNWMAMSCAISFRFEVGNVQL